MTVQLIELETGYVICTESADSMLASNYDDADVVEALDSLERRQIGESITVGQRAIRRIG